MAIGLALLVILLALTMWRTLPMSLLLHRLYKDPVFLPEALKAWGWLAPALFVLIQALQVILAPVPGEATGFLGGYLFGLTPGFVYSTVGLTLGTMVAFGVGRWLGPPVVRRFVPERVWERLGFIVEAEGAVLAFVIYLLPGFPKDIVSYLFGISPMPAWAFALVSTLGRMPGTWVLSAQGARTATGQYTELVLLIAMTAAVAIPVYYYRHKILGRFGRSSNGQR